MTSSPTSSSDPGSGGRSSAAFERLDEKVRRWIWEKKWFDLQDIQEAAVDPILAGDVDLIISAGTARGKTEAAFLPICSALAGRDFKGVAVLYVGPLKALINDQFERLEDLCRHLEIPVHRWHGDVDAERKKRLLQNPSGILLITPTALTLYVCWRVFQAVDGWLQLPWRGAGFVATLALITLVGYLATTFLWSTLFGLVELAMERVPLVRFLYNSLREVLGAFVGEKKRFDRPVVVQLFPGGNARALGFLTRESLGMLGLSGMVAVYLPQSYNFAGQVLLFPSDQVTAIEAASSVKAPAATACPVQATSTGRGLERRRSASLAPEATISPIRSGCSWNTLRSKPAEKRPGRPRSTIAADSEAAASSASWSAASMSRE